MSNISSRTKTFYDFIEMKHEIDRVLGYNQRGCGKHFHPTTGNFDDWCISKGYGDIDPDGIDRNSSRTWYGEYQEDIANSKWDDTPYLDFWHWQLKNCVNESFSNDSYGWVNISPRCAEDAEDWQKVIQQVFQDLG